MRPIGALIRWVALVSVGISGLLAGTLVLSAATPPVQAPAPQVQPAVRPGEPQPAVARRNLFLAPAVIRAALGAGGAPGGQVRGLGLPPVPGAVGPRFPMVPLPPVPGAVGPRFPMVPLPPVPITPGPLGGAMTAPPVAGAPGGRPTAEPVVVRPSVLGVALGADSQVVLEYEGEVVVARRGERTPWGVVVAISQDTIVLRRDGRIIRLDLRAREVRPSS